MITCERSEQPTCSSSVQKWGEVVVIVVAVHLPERISVKTRHLKYMPRILGSSSSNELSLGTEFSVEVKPEGQGGGATKRSER